MKCLVLLFAAALLALGGCDIGFTGIKGSGTVVSETRSMDAFGRVNIAGGAEVDIVVGSAESTCVVECDDNLLEYLSTEVVNGQLNIFFLKDVSASKSLRVHLTTEHLSKITSAGSVDAKIEGLNEPSLEIAIAGSGTVTCLGNVDELSASASGSGTFECLELVADKVNLNFAGSGKANVQAVQALNVSIAGSGEVHYLGSPQIDKKILGSGSVEALKQ